MIKNLEKAFEHYSKASKIGDLYEQNALGNSFELYSKAVETGLTNVQYNLADCYANGSGITKNLEKTFELFSKAAEMKHIITQNALRDCYQNEWGTMKMT
ncbi:hypothetical protein G9A89_002618 [Geosiphon pyriformis]|nr:hypothetical protein G9A89_002618 [Geosiphon pyriformis]